MNHYWSAVKPVLVTTTNHYWSAREPLLVRSRTTTGFYHPSLRVRPSDIVMRDLFTIFAVQTLRG